MYSGAHPRHAGAVPTVEIVPARTAGECREVFEVLNRVWGASEEAAVVDMGSLVAMAHSGNYVVQARAAGRVVGGAAGFFGPPGEPFHSHIAGVLPEAGPGAGLRIKLHQRSWCLERGTTRMHWTFDPLVARNAYFNIRKLGALPESYHPDLYGTMRDGINAGQPSDRMLMEWDLAAEPGGVPQSPASVIQDAYVALSRETPRPGPLALPPAGHQGLVLVAVPIDVEGLRREDPAAAREWRLATREAFVALFGDGWRVRDFTRSGQYVFGREGTL